MNAVSGACAVAALLLAIGSFVPDLPTERRGRLRAWAALLAAAWIILSLMGGP